VAAIEMGEVGSSGKCLEAVLGLEICLEWLAECSNPLSHP
jgi:hypothetical protein